MHGLPARHHEAEGGDDPHQEVHDRDDGIRLDERLGVPLDAQSGHGARPHRSLLSGLTRR
jgi:hypothetical protein